MSNVTGHDDGTLQVHTGRDRILREFLAHSIDTFVEVDLDTLATLTRVAQFLRNQFCGIGIHLLQPDTIGIDLGLDVTVSRARDTHTDRTTCTVTRQTDHTDVVGQILATELSTEADLVGLFQQFLLKVDVTEGTTCLITCGGQTIVILDRGELHGEQVLLGRGTTNHEGDVVRRTSGRTQRLHLLYEERNQGSLVLDGSLRHRVEVGLVG